MVDGKILSIADIRRREAERQIERSKVRAYASTSTYRMYEALAFAEEAGDHRPYVLDDNGVRWLLDGSGECA